MRVGPSTPSVATASLRTLDLGGQRDLTVVEGDTVAQLLAGAALDNSVNRGEVRLRNLERRVHHGVGQLTVGGGQQQAGAQAGPRTRDHEEHLELARLVIAGDGEAAAALMTEHIDRSLAAEVASAATQAQDGEDRTAG
mgnify:CR=1 FL=1